MLSGVAPKSKKEQIYTVIENRDGNLDLIDGLSTQWAEEELDFILSDIGAKAGNKVRVTIEIIE